jgi:hypothetical protein
MEKTMAKEGAIYILFFEKVFSDREISRLLIFKSMNGYSDYP